VARQLRTLGSLAPRQIGSLLFEAYTDWSTDGAARLGAALAYYTLFSIAPILVVVTGVAGLFLGRAAARGEIAPFLERALSPDGAKAAELMLQQTATPAGGIVTTAIGLVSLFLATSFLVNEIRQSLNIVWRVQPQSSEDATVIASVVSILSDRLYGFVVVAGAGLLVILSVMVNAAVAAAGAYSRAWLPLPEIVLQAINFLVTFGLISLMFTLLYKVLPDAHVSWGDASVGAIATALLFTLGGALLSTFVGKAAGGSLYGTAGSVLAMLVWVYYSAQVFFFGAELTRVFANRYGCRIEPRHRSLSSLARPHKR
jgi:membrane protein